MTNLAYREGRIKVTDMQRREQIYEEFKALVYK